MSSVVIPCMRYQNAPQMIDWLCETFGFERHLVVPGENGTIAHCQLRFGTGMIMVGSIRHDGSAWSCRIKQPEDFDGCETQTPYIVVDNVDELHDRVMAAGAEILMELTDQDYGSRDFMCRDPEGHIWSFGTYNPWSSSH